MLPASAEWLHRAFQPVPFLPWRRRLEPCGFHDHYRAKYPYRWSRPWGRCKPDLLSIRSLFPELRVAVRADGASVKMQPGVTGPEFRRHGVKAGIDIFAERHRLIVISDESICARSERVLAKRGVDRLTGLSVSHLHLSAT